VLSLEYRGYGESEGQASEAGLYLDAQAAYHFLLEQGIAPQNIIAYGYSLGSGVAVDLASRLELGALIVEAGYTSLPDAAKYLYRVTPRRWMYNRFDSLAKIATVKAPVLFIHAKDDLMIPLSQGKRLFAVRGGHAALLEQPQQALEKVMAFLLV
jgi:uncharacterized protein